MSVESVEDVVLGDTIQFKTISQHDNVVWTGTVIGICDYNIARRFTDVDAYYQEVKRTNPTIASKESLSYFLLEVAQTDSTSQAVAVAKVWIDESTLEKVSGDTYVDIRIHNISSSKAKDILSYINTAYPGYNAEILA